MHVVQIHTYRQKTPLHKIKIKYFQSNLKLDTYNVGLGSTIVWQRVNLQITLGGGVKAARKRWHLSRALRVE